MALQAKAPEKPKDTGKVYLNEFATCDEKGVPVRFRFQSARALLSVYSKIQDDSEKEDKRRGRIRKAYECARPFDPEKLKAKGLANLTNVNFGELTSQIDARSAALEDLALDTTNLVELRALGAEQAGPDAEKVGDIVAREFSATLRDSRKFLPALAGCVKECDLYGLGPVTWQDRNDYQPVSLERGQLKIAEDAPAISSDNELFFVESVLPNWYLFSIFDDPEKSRAEGWNIEGVRQYLIATFSEGKDTKSQAEDSTGTSTIESSIALWRQNRVFETRQFETVRVVHAYVREVSGGRKVTHYIVPASGDPSVFLFVRYEAYETMDECLIWLPASASEKYARAVRGIASKLLPTSDLNNRLLCQAFDFAFRDLTFKMKSTVPGGTPRASITEHGPFTIIGADAEPMNLQQTPNIQQLMGLRSLAQASGHADAVGAQGPAAAPETTFKGNSRKTKDEIAREGAAGERVEQHMYIMRLTVFDAIFRECFRRFMRLVNGDAALRRMYPGVDRFIKRCARSGVTKPMLRAVPEDYEIYMCRDLVTGGAGAKAAALTETLQTLGGNLDEQGRLSATRDVIVCRFGAKAADRYRPEIGRDSTASDAASHAQLENNDMIELSQAMAAPDQLHWSHLPVHMRLFGQLIEAAQAGKIDDPQRALDTLGILSDHIQSHTRMGGSQIGKEDDAKAIMTQLRSVRPVIQMLTVQAAAAKRAQEAQDKQQQAEMEDLQRRAEGHETQAKMHETDVKGQLKMREQDLLQQARLAGVQGKTQVDMLKAQQKAEIDRILANSKRFIDSQKIMGNPPPDTSALESGGMF